MAISAPLTLFTLLLWYYWSRWSLAKLEPSAELSSRKKGRLEKAYHACLGDFRWGRNRHTRDGHGADDDMDETHTDAIQLGQLQ